ncbi:MAG: hypothetical protein Tsb0010_02030 [Parvularculaceae bacterium]
MRRLVVLSAALLFAASLFGGLSALRPAGSSATPTPWTDPDPPPDHAAIARGYQRQIFESGVLGRVIEIAEAGPDGADEATGAAETAPFPEIVAVGVVDGEEIVSLRDSRGAITRNLVGDMVEGGWIITDITLEKVLAQKNGMEFEFTLRLDQQDQRGAE